MSNIHEALFLHLVKRGLDRAERAAEAVNRDHPDLTITVGVSTDNKTLEQADWSDLAVVKITFLVEHPALRQADAEYISLRSDRTSCSMEREIRAAVERIAAEIALVEAEEAAPRRPTDVEINSEEAAR
jgi:hypothetical protein